MKKFSLLFFLFLLSIVSCNNSDEDTDTDIDLVDISVSKLTVLCVGNTGTVSDLNISFDIPQDESYVDHYRAFLVKSINSTTFDLQEAESVDSSIFMRINKTGTSINMRLSSPIIDIDGDLIEENKDYSLFVMSVGLDDTANTLTGPAQFNLEQTNFVEILTEIPIGTAGIVVDHNGNIYSADFGLASSGSGGAIYKITPEGTASVFATGFTEASGNTMGPDGNIYQSDFSTGKVSRISTDGNVSNYVNGMTGPVGLTFDSSGNLYVANCISNTIKKVTSSGQVTTFASGSLFNCPNGITIDDDGNLYVANFGNGNLIKVTPDGTPSLFATLPGNNLGHMAFFENKLFVIARGANQIYEVSLDGETTKIAGNGNRGHKTGAALDAEFSLPNDIGFSPDGKYMYINDAVQLTGVPIAPSFLKRISLKK